MNKELPIKLKLPEGFLEPEERCGYQVTTKLKKIWAVELDLLDQFQKVCAKHNIKYQVFAGTLLGAVRHKGFIPWDDDLDVCLSRPEFDKLLKVAETEFTHPYFLQTASNDRDYFFPYARLRNSLTTGVITGCETPSYNNGIYMDVYVLEGYPASLGIYRCQLFFKRILVKFLTLYYRKKPRSRRLVELIMHSFRPVARMFKYSTLLRMHRWVSSWFVNSAERIFEAAHLDWSGWKYWLYKKEYSESIIVPYEMLQVPIPKDYHNVLSRIYGDYMEFPDPKLRGAWHESQIHFEPEIPYKEYLIQNHDSK